MAIVRSAFIRRPFRLSASVSARTRASSCLDSTFQFRKPLEENGGRPPFTAVDGRIARHHDARRRASWSRPTVRPRSRRGRCEMATDADLPAEHHLVADLGAAGDADLRCHQHVRPTVTPWPICTRLSIFVPALIRVSPTAGRSTVVFAPSSTSSSMTTVGDLRDLLVRAVAAADKAVAVATDDNAVLQDDAIAERDALADRRRSNESRSRRRFAHRADRDIRKDDGAVANRRARPDRDKRADGDVVTKLHVGGNGRSASIPGAGRHSGAKSPTARANARYGSSRAQHRRTAPRGLAAQDHGGARVVASAFSYFGLAKRSGRRGRRPGCRRHATNLDLAVAFEAQSRRPARSLSFTRTDCIRSSEGAKGCTRREGLVQPCGMRPVRRTSASCSAGAARRHRAPAPRARAGSSAASPELDQRRARPPAPRDAAQAMSRAAHRQEMTDGAKARNTAPADSRCRG